MKGGGGPHLVAQVVAPCTVLVVKQNERQPTRVQHRAGVPHTKDCHATTNWIIVGGGPVRRQEKQQRERQPQLQRDRQRQRQHRVRSTQMQLLAPAAPRERTHRMRLQRGRTRAPAEGCLPGACLPGWMIMMMHPDGSPNSLTL